MTDTLARDLETILVGDSPVMHRLRSEVMQYGRTGLPVLIEGPTGSGKELVARGLHMVSRRAGALVAFNVCAVPETMFEDALFGHVKGAFTGASSDAAGYLAEANGGTVVLDEINGLSATSQAKLLRAVETGEFRPVGAQRDRRSDFRLISTSNGDLAAASAEGHFRRDLYYRLSGLTIVVPGLRQRLSDLPALVTRFLEDLDRPDCVIDSGMIAELAAHAWPGNVRELRHVVARAVCGAAHGRVDAAGLRIAIGSERQAATRLTDEREELAALLRRHRWDAGQVAEALGVHRATVYRRIQRLGLVAESASAS